MLNEIKQIYESNASISIPKWKSMDKNELIIRASTMKNGPERDSYVSAIMLKYWNKIGRFYSRCKLVATPEDVHSWLTMAVLYALDNQPWNNPNSSIYGDTNGPDKVINRVMECRRITFYQQLNRYNRKINSAILSLDSLTEDYKDMVMPGMNDSTAVEFLDMVYNRFYKKDYVMAFVIDAVMNLGYRNSEEDFKKFVSHIKNMDDKYKLYFCEEYNIKQEDMAKAMVWVKDVSYSEMNRRVQYSLIKLKDMLRE